MAAAPRVRLPIRYKILAMLGVLLVGAVVVYTWLASSIFRQEKTALLYDINHSAAVNTAAQLRAYLLQIGNLMRFHTLAEMNTSDRAWRFQKATLAEASIAAVTILRSDANELREIASSGTPARSPELKSELARLDRSPYAFWIARDADGSHRIFLGSRVEFLKGGEKKEYIAVATLAPGALLSSLQSSTLFSAYLIRKDGTILLEASRSEVRVPETATPHPIARQIAGDGGARSGVASYAFEDDQWYGGYAPVGIGDLYFVSQANRGQMSSALELLVKRSTLFGLIVITATFLVSILFSRGITKNLNQLTERAERIGQGDLSTKIHLHSGDEVQSLAATFNSMIDALKESREAIERHNRELEQKVEERTQELKEKNRAIEEIQDKLIKSTQLAAAGEVAGKTAHEVLNPLTAIVGRMERVRQYLHDQQEAPAPEQLLEILEAWEKDYRTGGLKQLTSNLTKPSAVLKNATMFDEDLTNLKQLALYWMQQQEQLGGDVQFVRDQAGRIQRIVDGMRELVRSSTLREHTSCHRVLDEAALTMADRLERSGIKLVKRYEATNDQSVLNSDELIQIVTNLLRNASQAIASAERKDGLITIETSNEENQLYIDIIDNGKGVTAEQRDAIFEQGFTTKPPSEGTGLGLSISRRYARAFGGDVVLAYTEPGEGSCFRIVVPIAADAEMKIAS